MDSNAANARNFPTFLHSSKDYHTAKSGFLSHKNFRDIKQQQSTGKIYVGINSQISIQQNIFQNVKTSFHTEKIISVCCSTVFLYKMKTVHSEKISAV